MPAEGHVLRVFRFRPVSSEFDSFFRSVMLPDLRHLPGLIAVHGGRRDRESGGDRIGATGWGSHAGGGGPGGGGGGGPGRASTSHRSIPTGFPRPSTGRSRSSTFGSASRPRPTN